MAVLPSTKSLKFPLRLPLPELRTNPPKIRLKSPGLRWHSLKTRFGNTSRLGCISLSSKVGSFAKPAK